MCKRRFHSNIIPRYIVSDAVLWFAQNERAQKWAVKPVDGVVGFVKRLIRSRLRK